VNQTGNAPAINDIEEIIPYVTPWWQYLLVAAAVALLLLAAWLLWRRWKGRSAEAPVVAVDPWLDLSRRVQELQPEEMISGGLAKELYYQLSLLLRTGIELAAEIRATDMTFRELAPLMERKLPLRSEEVAAMQEFLRTADLVKFADRPATAGEAAKFRQDLMVWIAALKPRPQSALPSELARSGAVP
jgi:hypothetical protein